MAVRHLIAAAAVAAMVALAPSVAAAQTPSCPCSVFAPTDAPAGDAVADAPIEVGMKFRSSEDGYITGLRFYKQANNTGVHVGHLWTAGGQQLAEATFTNETASGWQEQLLTTPVPITANTTYITSYHSSAGRFASTQHAFDTTVSRPPLTAMASGVDGGNGVYKYGASAFPDETWAATNYWVDVTFEQTLSDRRAPQISDVAPSGGATNVPLTAKIEATFDEDVDPATVTDTTVTLQDAAGNAVAGTVSYDAGTRTARLTPAALQFGTAYTATVKGGASGVADVAGNRLAADRTWTFTTPPDCPCTVFAPGDGPLGDALVDSPVEVGMRFRSSEDGYITALRFYKQPNNTGRHIGHLWTSSGQQLAEVTFDSETASGWQEERLPRPVAITKDAVYVTSYYASTGTFAFSPGGLSAGAGSGPLQAPADGAGGRNGVYKYGPSAFPDQSFNATNYWVDATFTRTPPADTRAPKVSATTPAAGAAGAPVAATINATFDEDIDPLTVNAGSIVLKDPAGNPVTGTVTYDESTRTATLDPTAALQYGTTYTATVKSGNGGITDAAGNQLAADKEWTFSTPAQCPCTVFAPNQAPPGDAARDQQPIEVGMKFRADEDGFITRLRFFKQANNTGTHVGHLWSGTGELLATAQYTGESASGWQEVELPNAVPVVKDTLYVVSTYSASGFYAFDPGFFNASADRAPMHAPAASAVGGNGVYKMGASGFPDQTFNGTNYWVDATFERTVPPDTRGPIVTETTPTAGAGDIAPGVEVTARFDEQLAPASVNETTFTLRDAQGAAIAATVSYEDQARVAKLVPNAPLAHETTYTAQLEGGAGGLTDAAGNALAADKTWTFTTAGKSPAEGPGGPILVVTDPGDRFSQYYAEILRGEGLNAFALADGPVTPALLAGKQVVILATRAVSDAEVTTLTNWVNAGGNLIAMRPDKKLAGLLGLTDAGGTLAEGFVKVDNASAAGAGIEDRTLQYHGLADRYTASAAQTIAGLYSGISTPTTNPAVTLRNVGTQGGQAAAFTYDLARSIVYTRQGNPDWAGDKRDGLPPLSIRPNDLFYGDKAGDPEPDWVHPDRFDVPQADEQQRLLANLITRINLDRAPLPRFGYLPRGEKAAIILTGDDHAISKTPPYFDRLKSYSPAGCSVADWECIRATSYVYPDTAMTDAQVAAYQAEGFEIGLHLNTNCLDYTSASLETALSGQLAAFASTWPSARKPVSNRTHCIVWSDWAGTPIAERRHGIRFDTNYYYKGPESWVRKPGLMTGAGFPQRFADLDGTMIDVYQSMTQVTDEMDGILPTTTQIHTLLDNALGPKGYYGAFNVILHSDHGDHERLNDLVAEAIDRGVPVITSAQMLDWVDGRNASSFGDIAYSGGRLDFTITKSPKARGLETLVPLDSASGPLARITRDGQPVSWNRRTVKGVEYAVFRAEPGAHRVTYATDATPPSISGVAATADGEGNATVRWTTDEPATSRVDYGRTTSLGTDVAATATTTDHELELTGLQPNTTYRFRVTSVDAAGNSETSPATSAAPASFTTPPGTLVDSRRSDFAAGTLAGALAGATAAGADGEVQLQPAVGQEFDGLLLPLDWEAAEWKSGGAMSVSGGALVADAARATTAAFYEGTQTLEFEATFQPVNNQGVGFSRDLSDYPMATFHTGLSGEPFRLYATSGAGPATDITTPLPAISLSAPHRFRIEWSPTGVAYYVDGALVATHTIAIDFPMRPVVSDYGLHGANVKVHWLRMGSYAASGTITSRVLDSGPGANDWGTLSETSTRPTGTGITFETRSGATAEPDATWSAWQRVGAGGAIASPDSRFIQYRATLTGPGTRTPTLGRVAIGYTAGADAAPETGTVSLSPAAPRTDETVTANVAGFSDPDGDPLTYHYRWHRNGTRIEGAGGATLNLATAGHGDRGDTVRVEVYATDGRGAASDPAKATATVANTAPSAGSVTIKPATPSTNDVLTAVPAGFTDVDGDTLTYRYQWFRNGSAIAGQTGRKLDLAIAGHGDLGDLIEVEVRADDGQGGLSPAARTAKPIIGSNSTPVEGEVTIAPAAPRTDQTITATTSGFRDPDGDPLTYTFRWLRNGAPISGATGATLDLATADNGDRGDTIQVEVHATDDTGAASDPATTGVTVANSPPQAGTVTIKPTAPSTDDVISAQVSGFTDADGQTLTYRYQWFRNGAAIPGATGRTLDLAQAGNGDSGDTIAVDVEALDGSGGTSPVTRGSMAITGTDTHPVAAFGFEEAAGTSAANDAAGPDGTISGATRSDSGRFGRALSFDGTDDIVTVPDDPTLDLTTGMTLEAWVKPTAVRDWRTVMFKESTGGLNYGLYANRDTDVPSARVFVGGDTGADGTSELAPNKWSHLAATYDGATLKLFVDGAEISSHAVEGAITPGEGPLTFGANNVWGEQFRGLIDEVRIYNRPLTPEQLSGDMTRPVVDGVPAPPPDDGPEVLGQFAAAQEWPIVPVHLALMSDGTVAAWDGFEAAVNSERRWNPATGQFQAIATGRNLFCAGHINLQDGRLLVVGGHVQAYEGTKDTNLFDPQGGTWERGRDMSVARWYPSVTGLPDGKVFVASGDGVTLKEPNQPVPLTDASNTLPSIYDPATDRWTDMPGAARRMPLYPFFFVLPNGKLFDAGPDRTTRTLDFSTGTWTTVGTSNIDGHSAVMYRPGKILKSGTWSDPEFPGRAVTNRAETIDMTAASPAWQETSGMEYPRSFHTLTMLADGKVLASGGQTSTDGVDERTGILATEIWDPETGKWTAAASHRRPRLYHSSSLLLPDGRVLLAGGGAFGNAKNENSAEIYSPPYLFKGARPTISSAPSTIGYGESFSLSTPDAARISSVSLVRMGSVTHNLDMDQRFLKLDVTRQSGSVTVSGPANANVAPPGWYMAFLLDENGVPSVSRTIQVKPAADTTAPSAPSGLTATVSSGNVALNWAAATDNVGVTEYRVHRSTTDGFTPTASNRIATVTSGTSHTDPNRPAGRYYYRVVAADAEGNVGPPTASLEVVVPDTTLPTVSLTAPANGAVVSGTTTVSANASDNVGVASVQFTVDGANTGAPDTTAPYSIGLDTTALAEGAHALRAVARDAAGNARTSSARTVIVANQPAGLQAAYGFEEPSGTTATDQTGGNDGTISGATRVATGRFGAALSFDGSNDSVTVPNAAALNPATGLTLEGWVRPEFGTGARLLVGKERGSGLLYALYARGSLVSPMARVFTTSDQSTSGPSQLPLGTWSHLAMTWSGSTLRLYVNGANVATRSVGTTMTATTGPFRIGGTSVATAWFRGLLDEVRYYNRALSAAEITADMNAPVAP